MTRSSTLVPSPTRVTSRVARSTQVLLQSRRLPHLDPPTWELSGARRTAAYPKPSARGPCPSESPRVAHHDVIVEDDVGVQPNVPAIRHRRRRRRAPRESPVLHLEPSPITAYGPTSAPGATRARHRESQSVDSSRVERRGNACASTTASAAEGSGTSMTVRPERPADLARSTPAAEAAAGLWLWSAAKRGREAAFSSDRTPSTTAAPSPTSALAGSGQIGGRRRCGKVGHPPLILRGGAAGPAWRRSSRCRDGGVELLNHRVGDVDTRIRVKQSALNLLKTRL